VAVTIHDRAAGLGHDNELDAHCGQDGW
jgi:hypothetical protein